MLAHRRRRSTAACRAVYAVASPLQGSLSVIVLACRLELLLLEHATSAVSPRAPRAFDRDSMSIVDLFVSHGRATKVFDRDDPEDRLFAVGGYGAGRDQKAHGCCTDERLSETK